MGLFTELEDERKSKRLTSMKSKNEEADEESKVLQASELVSVVRKVLDLNQVDAKSRKVFKGYRSRLKDAKWQLHNFLGNVTASQFSNQVGMCLEGMEKNITQSHPNGDWRVCEYEVDLKKASAKEECVMLVVKWIDASNQQDLQYSNGVPAMNVNINNSGLDKDVLEALTSKSESSSDEELKDLLKSLIGVMAQNVTNPAPTNEDSTTE